MNASSIPSPAIGDNNPPLAESLQIEFADLLDKVQALADRANGVKVDVDSHGLTSDDDVVPLVEVGKDATKLLSDIDRKRLDRSAPLRADVETINGFFKTVTTRVDRIKNAFAQKVGEYEQAKRERERRAAAERARVAEEEAARKLKEAEEARHSVMGDVILNEAAKAEQEFQMAANAAVKAGIGPTRTEAGTVSQSIRWTFEISDASKIPLEELRPYFTIADLEKAIRAHVRAHRDTRPLAGVTIFPDTKTSFR